MAIVTTVIPVYNGEKYLKTALDSLAHQKRQPDRVIIIDNCSTDGTRDIARGYKGLPIEVVQNERNIGLFGNLNRALEYAEQTDYLHILTADDIVLEDFFEKLMPVLESEPHLSLAYSRFELIDSDGKRLPPWWFIDYKDNGAPPRKVGIDELLKKQSEMQTVLVPAAVIKTDRDPLPCKFREDMPQVADVVFYAELARFCTSIIEVREILCQYRIHPQNTTARNVEKLYELSREEWDAMKIITQWGKGNKFKKRLRLCKLKSLHSARVEVCLGKVSGLSSEKKKEIRKSIIERTGVIFWFIGWLAVRVRNLFWRIRSKKQSGPLGT